MHAAFVLLRVEGLKHAKAVDGIGERNLGFPRRGHSVMKEVWITPI